MPKLTLTLNGETTSVDVRENEYLAEVLRYRLGLTGTKIGCNEAECGICTVLVNGTPVDSCVYPALKADGAVVMRLRGWPEAGRGRLEARGGRQEAGS
jgi:aerobic-type carbon monoxide dehydrogenase small subunit (CoxS/CutS family)